MSFHNTEYKQLEGEDSVIFCLPFLYVIYIPIEHEHTYIIYI